MLETARVEKHVKSRLAVAAAHFNRDYKKGFQFLQVIPAACFLNLVFSEWLFLFLILFSCFWFFAVPVVLPTMWYGAVTSRP